MRVMALCCSLALLSSVPAMAQKLTRLPGVAQPEGELVLSSRALQLRYMTNAKLVNLDNSQLFGDVFLSEDRDVVGSIGLLAPTDLNFGSRISVEFGPRLYLALMHQENNDATALAFGTQIRFDLARGRDLAVVGSAYYAPDILTFGAADSVRDLSARAEIRVTRDVVGFGGWRWFDINQPGSSDRTLQDEIIAGLRWRFH